MRKIALVSLVVLLLGSCSEPSGDTALEDREERVANDAAASPEPDEAEGKEDEDKRSKGTKSKKSKKPRGGGGNGSQGGGDDVSEPAGRGGRDDAYTEGPAEDDHSSALFTAAGEYVYQQSGYERFCDAATCEREELPARQSVNVSVKRRTSQSAVVVAEARASDNRMMRTTTRFTRRLASVTDVYARFSYQGFTFENSYRPDPPVESLRFPLSGGQSWAGRWRDSTSGTYNFKVTGREQVEVDGRAVQAFKIAYEMTFSGEFDGSSQGTVWVDPATRVAVATRGRLDLRSSFGRYTTEGASHLTSGPRYR